MKRAFLFLVRALAFLVLVLLAAEGLLRIGMFFKDPVEAKTEQYQQAVYSRLYGQWLRQETSDPFLPPFLVYSNRDFGSGERLRKIFETTRLTSSRSWKSYDFIRGEGIGPYSIHSNALGFRGREHSREKPAGKKRVIVLGSYQAFGHGVEDEEAYPAQLERLLGSEYEVWNGGRHAASAIIGLARLRFEIFDYKPDALVLDYGFVDTLVLDDNFFPVALRFPDTKPYLLLRWLVRPLASLTARSLLWTQFRLGYAQRKRAEHSKNFEEVMGAMLDLAEQHKVPVILVRTFPTEPYLKEIFVRLAQGPVSFVDTAEVFSKHPPLPDEIGDWVEEIDPVARARFSFSAYRLNMLQLNARGNRVLAEALARETVRILDARKIRAK
ncbi:MAG: SGNH/GDSL hydrolase family protein [Bacteriovoracia bacterium]